MKVSHIVQKKKKKLFDKLVSLDPKLYFTVMYSKNKELPV